MKQTNLILGSVTVTHYTDCNIILNFSNLRERDNQGGVAGPWIELFLLLCIEYYFKKISARQQSCEKVTFSRVSVILFTQVEWVCLVPGPFWGYGNVQRVGGYVQVYPRSLLVGQIKGRLWPLIWSNIPLVIPVWVCKNEMHTSTEKYLTIPAIEWFSFSNLLPILLFDNSSSSKLFKSGSRYLNNIQDKGDLVII